MSSEKTIGKTKLIKLLSTFSVLEWKRFGRFVHSPYHNANEQLKVLYSLLKKAFPFEVLKDLEQERIYKKIYGKELFKLSKFQNLCSDLYELATDFMVDVYLKKEKRKKKKLVIDALSERNYELFRGASQQLIKEVDAQEYFLDGDDFLLLFQLHEGLHHHSESDRYTINLLNFDKARKNLTAFYENHNTQLTAEGKGSQNFLNKNDNLDNIKSNQLKELFQAVIELHKHEKMEHYFALKGKIVNNWNQLKTKYKIDLLIHLINFSYTNVFIQKKFGQKEIFELYKLGIMDKLFIFNGKMRDSEFLNIGIIGFSLSKNSWTEQFIRDHKKYLPVEGREILLSFIYAYKANFHNNYKKVIELLSTLNPSNKIMYLPKIKTLLIRAYFNGLSQGEEHYRSPMNYEIESFKKMLLRNDKLPELRNRAYINFLDLTKKLIALHSKGENKLEQIDIFESLLNATQPLALKKWLQDKLIELKAAASK